MMIDSLIPLRNAEIRSDGARIISLLRGDREAQPPGISNPRSPIATTPVPELRQELFCEAAFVQARYRNRMELAKAWFARAEQLRLGYGPQNSVSPNAVLLPLTDRH